MKATTVEKDVSHLSLICIVISKQSSASKIKSPKRPLHNKSFTYGNQKRNSSGYDTALRQQHINNLLSAELHPNQIVSLPPSATAAANVIHSGAFTAKAQ